MEHLEYIITLNVILVDYTIFVRWVFDRVGVGVRFNIQL